MGGWAWVGGGVGEGGGGGKGDMGGRGEVGCWAWVVGGGGGDGGVEGIGLTTIKSVIKLLVSSAEENFLVHFELPWSLVHDRHVHRQIDGHLQAKVTSPLCRGE